MKVDEIEKLLVRYYDGETTEAEEKELKRFFTGEEVPAHLLAEKELFLQMSELPEPEVPIDMESKLSHLVDEWDIREKRTVKVKKHARVLRLQWIGSVAASLLILFSIGMYMYKPDMSPAPQDTCATPEEAYAEAQRALLMLSSTINKGMAQMETVETTTEKIQESVNQQLNRINTIKK